jgi:predicted DNA-binding protein (UPF0251 family)
MMTPRPRTTAEAQVLLADYAANAAAIDAIETLRNSEISAANAKADEAAVPLRIKRDAMRDALEAWWAKAGAALTQGKRRSIELGGCELGLQAGRSTLVVQDEAAVVAALKDQLWAAYLINVKVTLDKRAALKALDGPHSIQLKSLGLAKQAGEDAFFVKPVVQHGVIEVAG